MLNLLNSDGNYEWITSIVACVAVAITILFYIISNYRDNKIHIVEKFGKIYTRTFSLREKISKKYESQLNNEAFFYEIDNILENNDILTEILDYLTEMEDLFLLVVTPKSLNASFKKLASYALYTRLLYFYGLIMILRKTNNNPKMFQNYCNVVNRLAKIKKFRKKASFKYNKYYIGIRTSDCQCSSTKYFKGNLAMFMEGGGKYEVRPNQNVRNKVFFPFLEEQISHIIDSDKNAKFICYNGNMAYGLPKKLLDFFICLNDQQLLNFLNDKISCKEWLIQNSIPVIEFETTLGNDILKWNLNTVFHNSKEFVLQSCNGGGGVGTFVINKNNFNVIKSQVIPIKRYLYSPYIANSISVNTHVFISEKQTILSPGSVQIVELINHQLSYRGADFIAYKQISEEVRTIIKQLSFKIANLLRSKNYRGVAGLDFIITSEGQVYCAEINPRFQASSVLLDLYLKEHVNTDDSMAKNIYELNLQAFNNTLKTDLHYEDEIHYSCYYYYNDGLPEIYFSHKYDLLKANGVILHSDGLILNSQTQYDCNSYMFRAIFTHAICSLSPEYQLWVNDNIVIRNAPNSLLELKVALLNQGVRLLNLDKKIKTGVYESVDITFISENFSNTTIDINCAYNINLSQYSPFALNCSNNKLYYYDMPIGDIKIENDLLANLTDVERKILYIATDRLRIKLISGCEFKNYGSGCAFCNVPLSEQKFCLDEINSALKNMKDLNLDFRHILIGGGTYLEKDVWERIIALAQMIKQDSILKNKPISLMTVLPPIIELPKLKAAGIEEVAFNMEIANDELANTYMPGKHRKKDDFYFIMNEAIRIFGLHKVRSALIIGLDKKDDLIYEAKKMAENGIVPCLSALRALPGAKLKLELHPTNKYICEVYLECVNAIKNINPISELGPVCTHCRNNMVIL